MTFAARFIGWVKALFQVQRGLRLRASASAYFSRTTAASGGNQKVLTYSGWVKRGAAGGTQALLASGSSGAAGYEVTILAFTATNTLRFVHTNNVGASVIQFDTTAAFRDPSAWYHVFLQVDTNQATNSNGVKIWVNGLLQGGTFAAYFQNAQLWWTSPSRGIWQGYTDAPSSYYDGYLSEVNFIDGQSLTPSSFGEFDPSGNWRPKAYSGTYGTNGFRLDFSDPTSLTTLMLDRSGNGNNWTANNISLTAGATYDSMLDVPLGGGGGERGNYATFNPIYAQAVNVSMLNANLSVNLGSATNRGAVGTIFVNSGKWYWEVNAAGSSAIDEYGVISAGGAFNAGSVTQGAVYLNDGRKIVDGAAASAYGAAFTTGDIIGVALDNVSGSITFYKNNVSQGAITLAVREYAPAIGDSSGTGSGPHHINFGQRPFSYTPPTGFKALHTGNLPDPVIQQPSKHVLARLRTGGGVFDSVSGLPLAPELIWVKGRSAATNHQLFDKVRGAFKSLASNSSAAEQDLGLAGIRSFNPDGYTMGNDTAINTNNAAYVDWLWKAGGAAVANNAGSIASQVSANPQAGFSIATYTGNSANATVGHGLGVTPKLVIVKARTGSATTWVVYHKDANASPASGYLALNDTIAFTANASVWGNVEPTPSNFSVSNNPSSNASDINYVAYCFAEIPGYSKIGRYTANASADGPFIHCGFRPRFVIIKRTDSTSEWRMYDSTRSDMNPVDDVLRAEQAIAEGVSLSLDFTATGFKIRTTDANLNGGAAPYIFMAFAEAPLKYALAR